MMCTMHRFWKISGVRQSICHPGTIEPRSHEPLAHRILVLTICTDTPHKTGHLLETESTHVHTNYALMNRAMGGASALQASRQCHLATLTGPTDSHSAVFWHGSRGEESAPLPRLENFTFLPGSIWQHNLAHEGILDPSQRRVLWNVHAGE